MRAWKRTLTILALALAMGGALGAPEAVIARTEGAPAQEEEQSLVSTPVGTELVAPEDADKVEESATTERSEGEATDTDDAQPTQADPAQPDPTQPTEAVQPSLEPQVQDGWAYEDGSYVYYKDSVRQTGWLVTDVTPQGGHEGYERYWLDDAGHLVMNRLLTPEEAGYWAFASESGRVARGRVATASGNVYLADNDGRLAGPGWVVSDAFGQGLQRYYVDPSAHACLPGYSALEYPHYTRPEGYVLRGKYADGGRIYLADNDGRLYTGGWVVSDAMGDGIQRYYVEPSSHACEPGYSESGWPHYTRPEGYVVRGKYDAGGRVYLANNDGRLEGDGWVVSNAYGDGIQRYYVDPTAHACVPGYSDAAWPHYTRPEGYVVRGKYAAGGKVYLADNDGRIYTGGWVVSNAMGDGIQRYYVDPTAHACVPGYSEAGWPHYTHPDGYVVRGLYTSGSTIWLANNEGVLANRGQGGWLVTSEFGQGMQRYYIDGATHGIKAGLNHDGSWWFYTRPEGYVVRGLYTSGNNIYIANNDGRLPDRTTDGWVVTSDYGQGLQRYYIYGATHAAKRGYSTDGYPHFTTDEAYVLRGTRQYGGGVLLAANNGRLATSTGWLDSSSYGHGSQRYYLDTCCTGGVIGARTGMFTVGSNKYYGYPNVGHIARNTDVSIGGVIYSADSNGVLTTKYPIAVVNMALRANNYSSSTGWLIMLDRGSTKVAIFRGYQGNWTLHKWFDCSVGASGSPTVSGTFRTGSQGYSFGEEKGYSAYYWTQIYSDYLFHSVLYYPYTREVKDGRMNAHVSAGCVRLHIENAKWIYDNIPWGTTVNIV